MQNHYLVIGAGPVGLAVAKSFKLNDIPYHHVEAEDDLGGNWYHGVYETVNVLSSREATEYPDFPMPADYPDFPSGVQMCAYYNMYADHYSLRSNIRFNMKVIAVTPVSNSLWSVRFENGTQQIYKGVMICNGHHWSRRYPNFEGAFTGESFHSKDYKSPEQLRGKRVLVVGAGNSAFDIASECSRVSKKSLMSVRRGIWVFPKTFMGKPLSHFQKGTVLLPNWLKMQLAKIMLRIAVGSYKDYGFPKPTIKLDERHPTINTDTLINIKNGKIKVKGGVRKLMGKQVEFEDGSLEEVDTIVYATGFHVDFPFLPQELNRVEKKCIAKVYGFGMYDDYKGIYLVGWFQPRGGVGSLIAPYADLLTSLVKVQDKIETPVGRVLKEMGEKISDTHLFGGPEFLRWVKKKQTQLSKIERLGQQLDSKNPGFHNEVLDKEVKVAQAI